MEDNDKKEMINLLEAEIKSLNSNYTSLLSKIGKFEQLKDIKQRLRRCKRELHDLMSRG